VQRYRYFVDQYWYLFFGVGLSAELCSISEAIAQHPNDFFGLGDGRGILPLPPIFIFNLIQFSKIIQIRNIVKA
jgi:hypothetical protein